MGMTDGGSSTLSTASSEHLLVASAGTFTNPSSGGQLLCGGKMIAWDFLDTTRSFQWTSPQNATVTLVSAGGYGPVLLYQLKSSVMESTTAVIASTAIDVDTIIEISTTPAAADTSMSLPASDGSETTRAASTTSNSDGSEDRDSVLSSAPGLEFTSWLTSFGCAIMIWAF